MPDQSTKDEYDELRRVFIDILEFQPRRGWKGSLLSQGSVEYILQRESVINSILSISQVDWQNINPNNKQLANQIKEQAIHSLKVLLQSIREVERDHL